MRVLVTGGAGFIGQHVVRALRRAGYEVRVYDNLSTGRRENLPGDGSVELVVGDVRDAPRLSAAAAGCAAIIHLAAHVSMACSYAEPRLYYEVNVDGTFNVGEAARQNGVRRLVFASSASVYGDPGSACHEALPPNPCSPYGFSKLFGELLLRQETLLNPELSVTCLRKFNVYGPGQPLASPSAGVVTIFGARLRRGEPLSLCGDGQQKRDFVHVRDIAEAYRRALDLDQPGWRAINIGSGQGVTLLELVRELSAVLGVPADVRFAPAREGDIRFSIAVIMRARQLLGWAPSISLREGLEDLYRPGAASEAGEARPDAKASG